jgi:hypothetical protein
MSLTRMPRPRDPNTVTLRCPNRRRWRNVKHMIFPRGFFFLKVQHARREGRQGCVPVHVRMVLHVCVRVHACVCSGCTHGCCCSHSCTVRASSLGVNTPHMCACLCLCATPGPGPSVVHVAAVALHPPWHRGLHTGHGGRGES